MKTTKRLATILTCLCMTAPMGTLPSTCFAEESLPFFEIEEQTDIERGATTYYYTPISYSFNNKRGRTYLGTRTYTSGISVSVSVGPCTITYTSKGSGTYKVYSYVTDIVLTARKTDAMGHNLGNVTFTNNGVTVYEYIPV